MKTAPNTAPATALPSLGDSSEPITTWLPDYPLVNYPHFNVTFALCKPGAKSFDAQDRPGNRTLNSDPIIDRMTMAKQDTTTLFTLVSFPTSQSPNHPNLPYISRFPMLLTSSGCHVLWSQHRPLIQLPGPDIPRPSVHRRNKRLHHDGQMCIQQIDVGSYALCISSVSGLR